MHHLIWIKRENLSGVTVAEQLAAVGLADHADGAQTVPCEGPDGGGTLFGWNALKGRLHYHAAQQTWLSAVADGERPAGRYHVGIWNDSPPTEADLRRPYRYGGRSVELGNGETWLVPTPEELPHVAKLADDGSWRFVVQRNFHDYYLRAMQWVERLAVPEGVSVFYGEMLAVAVEALTLNYRLPPELISHLELFDQVKAAECFRSALGLAERD